MKSTNWQKQVFSLILSLFFGVTISFAQENDTVNLTIDSTKATSSQTLKDSTTKKYLRNNVKMNLSSLALNNYSFFYERSISKKISFQAGYRYMPSTKLSEVRLSKQVLKHLEGEDGDVEDELDKMVASGNAITAEFRFYTGRKPGARGFYASLYGRYSTFKFDYDYDYSTNTTDYLIPLKSDIKGIGGGLLLGAQFLVAKRIILDIYLIGAHIGTLKGKGSGITDLSNMSDEEKADLKSDLESLAEFGSSKLITADVKDDGVYLTIKGPFAGIRALGISVGIAF